ncbi:hypothetical protein E2C01_101311 [Portunus trituberculatus]|uniref:Uncharacterized protein n=1 Tax=Portunus trituberculatus TaxID=210409 RepID=A0A5B7K5D8_PORTR|nr:hypothetical protein [Portunus trituberculatus]
MRYILGLREDHWTSYYKPLVSRDHFTIMVLPTRPRSRGFVELVSRDPRQPPKVVRGCPAQWNECVWGGIDKNLSEYVEIDTCTQEYRQRHRRACDKLER